MKSTRFLVPILLALALAGSAGYLIQQRTEGIRTYQALLAAARETVEKGVLADGVALYEQALDQYQSEEICLEVGNVYLEAGELQLAERWYSRELAELYPESPETYAFGLQVYIAAEDYKGAFEVYDECLAREASSDTVETLVDTIRYAYDLTGYYDAVGPFSSQNGYAAIQYGDRWGYLGSDGGQEIGYQFQSAGVFGSYAAVTTADGEPLLIDAEGEPRLTASYFSDSVTSFGAAGDGWVLATDGLAWSYYQAESYTPLAGGYTAATPAWNGVGAVTEDGDNWALIGADGTLLTGYDYRQVLSNDEGAVYAAGVAWVQQDSRYWLVDAQGQLVSETGYEDARAFEEADGWAAAQKNGKWIFVNGAGEERDLGAFDQAQSFSGGLAAVCIDGLWGYIDLEGNLVIDCVFAEATSFGPNGMSFVRQTSDQWNLLTLYRDHH